MKQRPKQLALWIIGLCTFSSLCATTLDVDNHADPIMLKSYDYGFQLRSAHKDWMDAENKKVVENTRLGNTRKVGLQHRSDDEKPEFRYPYMEDMNLPWSSGNAHSGLGGGLNWMKNLFKPVGGEADRGDYGYQIDTWPKALANLQKQAMAQPHMYGHMQQLQKQLQMLGRVQQPQIKPQMHARVQQLHMHGPEQQPQRQSQMYGRVQQPQIEPHVHGSVQQPQIEPHVHGWQQSQMYGHLQQPQRQPKMHARVQQLHMYGRVQQPQRQSQMHGRVQQPQIQPRVHSHVLQPHRQPHMMPHVPPAVPPQLQPAIPSQLQLETELSPQELPLQEQEELQLRVLSPAKLTNPPPLIQPEVLPETHPYVPPPIQPEILPEALTELPPEAQPEVPPEAHPEVLPETQPEIPPEIQPEIPPEIQPEIPPETQPEVPLEDEVEPRVLESETEVQNKEKSVESTDESQLELRMRQEKMGSDEEEHSNETQTDVPPEQNAGRVAPRSSETVRIQDINNLKRSFPNCGRKSKSAQQLEIKKAEEKGKFKERLSPDGKKQATDVRDDLWRVVGGEVSVPDSWPWMSGIFSMKDGKKEFFCGSALISQRYTLTAAHCFDDVEGQPDPSIYKITLGHNIHWEGATYDVKQVLIHPGYHQPMFYHDIALIKTKVPVELSLSVQPVCLPSYNLKPIELVPKEDQMTFAGWGINHEEGDNPSVTLKELTVPVFPHAMCNESYMALSESFPEGITEHFVCAGHLEGGKDTCKGDSGGPLVAELSDKTWLQVGVLSSGYGCARAGFPGLYTKTADYLDWIYYNTDLMGGTFSIDRNDLCSP